jgi:hypothetical protein
VRLALFALAAALVVACTPPSVPALRVTRFSVMTEHHYPAFDRSVNDAEAARRVSDALRALPPTPRDRFCPAGFGLRYRLTFNEAGRVTLLVVVEGDACREVIFSDADRRATDDPFWDLLADTLGSTKSVFFLLPDELRR